ncbi:MAG: RNA polymerase sigma factor [Myxococcales bacterium]|nr:RNA polymerase sigma factor [Myxococcales bacterium]
MNPNAREIDPEQAATEAIERGDLRRAVTILMAAYGDQIYRHCVFMLGDAGRAQDIQQKVFVQAWRDLGRFSGRSSLRTWLFAIARNRCRDDLKGWRRFLRRFELDGESPERAGSAPSAEQRLATEALKAPLAECLQRLAPAVRSVVLLRFQNEMSFVDIAESTAQKANTVQVQVARAMPVLRKCLEARGIAEAA